MKRETSRVGASQDERPEPDPRKDALEVLLEAREKLLSRMTEDILSQREVIREGGSHDGLLGFELEEIEDRYSARLNALNALLDNLEYRRPKVEHCIRVLRTTASRLERDLSGLLLDFEDWDVVGLNTVKLEGEDLLAVVAFSSEVYPD